MPSSDKHIRQASHNLEFLKSFYNNHKYDDWSITVGFYASVHIIENAIFLKKKILFNKHEFKLRHSNELDNLLKQNSRYLPSNCSPGTFSPHKARIDITRENFSEIAEDFKRLYNGSITARYKYYSHDKVVVEMLINVSLKNIIDWSNNKFKTEFKFKI